MRSPNLQTSKLQIPNLSETVRLTCSDIYLDSVDRETDTNQIYLRSQSHFKYAESLATSRSIPGQILVVMHSRILQKCSFRTQVLVGQ